MKALLGIHLFWSDQERTWAYKLRFTDEVQDGLLYGLEDFPNYSQLEEAVSLLAWEHGLEIQAGEVACDPITDGGFALWSSSAAVAGGEA